MPPSRPRLRVLLILALPLLLYGVWPAVAKSKAEKAAEKAERAAIAKLPEEYQKWLEEVELLITQEERAAFLKLDQDYQRDAFIERFWQMRDAYTDTARNEFRERWEDMVETARHEYGGLHEDRSRMLLLNGPPNAAIKVRCTTFLWPLEIWYYDGSERIRDRFYLVFVQRGGLGMYRLWEPAEGVASLAQFPPPNADNYAMLNAVNQQCQGGDQIAGALGAVIRTGSLAYSTMIARLQKPPEPTAREWVATFQSYSTDLAADAPTFKATLEIAFPGRHQSRTLVQGVLAVPVAEAGSATFGDAHSFNFLLTGEVLRGKRLFETFRYKFDFPTSQVSGEKIPMVFERSLRPGSYTLSLKLEDLNSHKLFGQRRELVVPDVTGPEVRPPDNSETAKLLAEANAAISSGQTTIKLIPPPGDLQAGMVRFDTLAAGADIASVSFALDGKPILVKRSPPYSVELDLGTLPRLHSLRVTALNAQGGEIASDELSVNAGSRRFSVRLLEPRHGRHYAKSLRAEAQVDVPEGQACERVEFYLNETLVATLYQPPYVQAILLGPNPVGYVRVVAYLVDGNSTERVVFVNTPENLEEVDIQYVELYSTVIDRNRRPVRGLEKKDFQVVEDGKPQEIVRFEQVESLPVHVEILLDTSASMEPSLEAARAAALRFFQDTLKPKDRAAVITFNDRPALQVKFTNELIALAGGLAGLKAERGTALYDSVIFSLYYLNGVKGQRALLLLSDGKDENSRFTFEECLEYSRRAGVAIYPIGLGLGRADRDVRKKLARLAEETGGESFMVSTAQELGGIYAQIEQELRSRYLIAYQSTNTAGGDKFRSVDLKILKPGLDAKTIRGYYP